MFKVPKHRRFEVIPRYHDPEKEERERRLRISEFNDSPEEVKSRLREAFNRKKNNKSVSRHKVTWMRLLIFVLLLLAFFYLIMS